MKSDFKIVSSLLLLLRLPLTLFLNILMPIPNPSCVDESDWIYVVEHGETVSLMVLVVVVVVVVGGGEEEDEDKNEEDDGRGAEYENFMIFGSME